MKSLNKFVSGFAAVVMAIDAALTMYQGKAVEALLWLILAVLFAARSEGKL